MGNNFAMMDSNGQVYYPNHVLPLLGNYPYYRRIDTKVIKTPNNADRIIKKLISLGFKSDLITFPIKLKNIKQSNLWEVRFKEDPGELI